MREGALGGGGLELEREIKSHKSQNAILQFKNQKGLLLFLLFES